MHGPRARTAHAGSTRSLPGSAGTTHDGLPGANRTTINRLTRDRAGGLPGGQTGPGCGRSRRLAGSGPRLLQARQHGRIRRDHRTRGGLASQIRTHLSAQRYVRGRRDRSAALSRRSRRASGSRHRRPLRRRGSRRRGTDGRNGSTGPRAGRHDHRRWRRGKRTGRWSGRRGGRRSWSKLTGRRSRRRLRREWLPRTRDDLSRTSGRGRGPGWYRSRPDRRMNRMRRRTPGLFASSRLRGRRSGYRGRRRGRRSGRSVTSQRRPDRRRTHPRHLFRSR